MTPTEAAALVDRLTAEGLIGLGAAAELCGGSRKSVRRWCLKGCRGPDGAPLRLESILVGGVRKTTRPAVLRFLAAQQGAAPPARRSAATAAEWAEAERLGLYGPRTKEAHRGQAR